MKASFEEILEAVETGSRDVLNFIDAETGEMLFFVRDGGDGELCYVGDEEFAIEDVEADTERFLHVNPMDVRQTFRVMEDFVEGINPGRTKDKLAFALTQKKPLGRFRTEIAFYASLQERWHEYLDERRKQITLVWLEENGCVPEDMWNEEIHGAKTIGDEPEAEAAESSNETGDTAETQELGETPI